ncbi:MAG: potassium/hydrogen antiporter [Solirubrobacteraceae bacterium]|jgi:cell volume regulation protein A|nr:potassium/hydrogen antiporter [Solirubrobacteraceae bacterium]
MRDEELILVAGALLAGGIVASLLANRVRVPGLILFLGLGMAVGSEGVGWISFSDYELARTIGTIALGLILFDGGLRTGLHEVRSVLGPAMSLATVGTLITAAITGFAAHALLPFSWLESLLLGAVVASTDGAAIFAMLRDSTLRRRVARTLESESGLNDPLAILLVLGFIQWLEHPGYGVADMAWLLARQVGIGAAVGAAVGWAAVQALQRARLATAGLYPVASLAIAALAFGGAGALHGSGFLAVYLAGLALGSAAIPARQTVIGFHDGVAWVAQIVMFLSLGLLVFPSQLLDVAPQGTAVAFVLAFVARPLATFVATLPFGFSRREQIVLGWAGLRGAVPVVLATFPVIAGVGEGLEIFNLVFFAVLLSTLLQGATFEPLARALGVTTDEPALPQPLTEVGTVRRMGAEVLEHEIREGDAAVGSRVRELGLPRDAVVNLIVRDEQAVPPRGSTRLRTGDRLHVLVRQEASLDMPVLVERWRAGPTGPPPRPVPTLLGRRAVFRSGPWPRDAGDAGRPREVGGQEVVDLLRIRRDVPGTLAVLDDGRYAVTGPVMALGGRDDVAAWARRRLRDADEDERAWLQNVIGALAADLHRRPS